MMEGAPPPAPPPPHQYLNDPSPLWFPGLLLATDGMSDSSSGVALSNEGRHASSYMKGTTSHNGGSSNSLKRSMPSADNELALCSNLAHLDLRRVAESLSRQHNGGSIGSVASTTSTESSSTTAAAAFDSMDDDGSVNYGRMRKRRRHSRTHNAYGGLDFQGILQSLFQRGEGEGNQPSTVPSSSSARVSGADGAPPAMVSGNIMEDLASPQHF
jgi:hypothetical protein